MLQAVFGDIDHIYEVVVVHDGSSDHSVQIASEFRRRLIDHSRNLGKGASLRTGLENAKGEKVLFIDADNNYPAELIPQWQTLWTNKTWYAVPVTPDENIPLLNCLGNQLFDQIIHAIHAVEGGDLLRGMCGGWRHCLRELDLESQPVLISKLKSA